MDAGESEGAPECGGVRGDDGPADDLLEVLGGGDGVVVHATHEQRVRPVRIAALPIGIAVAFIIWRTMDWFFHHALAIEPQLYDAVFGWLG